MVDEDIEKINNAESLSVGDCLKLHRSLDGRYQSCIKGWGKGLWGFMYNHNMLSYSCISNDKEALIQNMQLMKGKLETFKHGLNAVAIPEKSSTNITFNNNNNINFEVSFSHAVSNIQDNGSLTNEETKEILDKISFLEDVYKSKESNKSKWEKVKPVIKWVADKSFDVAMQILPLFLKLKE